MFANLVIANILLQDNTAAKGEFIGVVTDAAHHNVKNNKCQGNNPKCKGM